jgi:hypothetical protein
VAKSFLAEMIGTAAPEFLEILLGQALGKPLDGTLGKQAAAAWQQQDCQRQGDDHP